MERSVLTGIATLRWLGWVWMATVAVLARRSLEHPLPAGLLILAALAVTVWATVALRRDGPTSAMSTPLVATEVVVAAGLLLADGFVYDAAHVFSTEASLGVAWPLAGVLVAGLAWGGRWGTGVGVALGLARALSSTVNAPAVPAGEVELVLGLAPPWLLSLVTSTFLYALAGGVAGYAAGLLRRAEAAVATAQAEVAATRAREEVARTLHDGVLQTLAVVARRAADPDLTRLARDQERELRAYLFGSDPGHVGRGDLGDALRAVADRTERSYGLRVQVLVPDDLPDLADVACRALVGAAGEAMTNAGKHAQASRLTVFVEPTGDGVTCTVRDDGVGFDVDRVPHGVGLSRSIVGRVEEVGGRAEVRSRAGRGTEVRLEVPAGGAAGEQRHGRGGEGGRGPHDA